MIFCEEEEKKVQGRIEMQMEIEEVLEERGKGEKMEEEDIKRG